MPAKKKAAPKKKAQPKRLRGNSDKYKLHKRKWLNAFLNEGAGTFFHVTESAIAAGYQCKNRNHFSSVGSKCREYWHKEIEKWIDEHGLSHARLKAKLFHLLSAKKTQFYMVPGVVIEDDLPPGARIVLTGAQDGEVKTLVAVDTDEPELQRRSLDMAFKAKGLYAPERWEVTGKDGGPIQTDSEVTAKITALREARERHAKHRG
jgi:hypothetical protein